MKIIIVGAHAVGTYLAQLLSRNQEEITVIDPDPDRLEKIGGDYDLLTLCGSPSSVRTLQEANTQDADLFIAVTKNENENINSCILAHALHAKKTVAKVDDAEFIAEDVRAIYKNLGDVHGGALVMLGIKLRSDCEILDKPLRELCGPDDPYHVVAIKRNRETIIPGGNDELKSLDLAYFMTTKQYIPYVRKITGKEYYADVKNVMVMGGGTTAVRAIQSMPEYMDVKVFEVDPERCQELNQQLDNCLVINGDARDIALLEDEGIGNTQAFVALTGNSEANILACLAAKKLGIRKTVADVENMDYANMAQGLDIGTIINKKAIAASRIYQMMLDVDVMNVTFLMSANADIAEFVPKEESKVTKVPVKDIGLPKGTTIGGLVRNGEGLLVSGHTQIQAGDSVVVFCHNVNLKKVEKFFN